VLKDQSERERCAPELFDTAAARVGQLADEEEAFYRDLQSALGA
jgi:hypothetical protein